MSDDDGSAPDDPPAELLRLLAVAEAAEADSPDAFAAIDAVRADPGVGTVDGLDALRVARLLAVSGDPNDLPTVAELAGRAHRSGVSGAGPIHAEAVDKIHLFQNQPQPYGTVMVEHQGEIVQPPVDHRVPDADRQALGLPTLAEMQDRMAEVSRQMATDRASAPGALPVGQRFARVWTDPDPSELRALLAAEDQPAWANGDILTFVVESVQPVIVT
ncbi:MAG: hypothetical protein AAFO29_21590, partial [Actinomycetota bacterium]